jgi:hypothetical protein
MSELPRVTDFVETRYTKATGLRGVIIEMKLLESGVQAFKIYHKAGFEGWYMRSEFKLVRELSLKGFRGSALEDDRN